MSEVYTTHVGLDALEIELEFRSLRSHINDLRDKLAEYPAQDSLAYFEEYNRIEVLDIVEDPLFATLLNRDGEIQIGETVHKVGKTFVHSVNPSHEHLLDEIDNYSDNAFQNEHVDVFRIKRASDSYVSGKVVGSDVDTCRHRYNGNRYRINGKSWITSYPTHASAGTQTYHYKRINIFGGYSKRRVNYISFTVSTHLYHSHENGVEYHNEKNVLYYADNEGGVFKIYIDGQYTNYGISGYINSSHYVSRSDGTSAGCVTDVTHE